MLEDDMAVPYLLCGVLQMRLHRWHRIESGNQELAGRLCRVRCEL